MVETVVWWHLQGNHQKPGFLRWCEVDFVHPQYWPLSLLSVEVTNTTAESPQLHLHTPNVSIVLASVESTLPGCRVATQDNLTQKERGAGH